MYIVNNCQEVAKDFRSATKDNIVDRMLKYPDLILPDSLIKGNPEKVDGLVERSLKKGRETYYLLNKKVLFDYLKSNGFPVFVDAHEFDVPLVGVKKLFLSYNYAIAVAEKIVESVSRGSDRVAEMPSVTNELPHVCGLAIIRLFSKAKDFTGEDTDAIYDRCVEYCNEHILTDKDDIDEEQWESHLEKAKGNPLFLVNPEAQWLTFRPKTFFTYILGQPRFCVVKKQAQASAFDTEEEMLAHFPCRLKLPEEIPLDKAKEMAFEVRYDKDQNPEFIVFDDKKLTLWLLHRCPLIIATTLADFEVTEEERTQQNEVIEAISHMDGLFGKSLYDKIKTNPWQRDVTKEAIESIVYSVGTKGYGVENTEFYTCDSKECDGTYPWVGNYMNELWDPKNTNVRTSDLLCEHFFIPELFAKGFTDYMEAKTQEWAKVSSAPKASKEEDED